MTTYAIGDLQGCLQPLKSLLKKTRAASADPRWLFAGDLVNRGPSSLQTLRHVRALGASAKTVLGNHDLHLLAAAHGIRRVRDGDSLHEILQAPDCDDLLDWLRRQPLALMEQGHLLVHAGLLPQWSAERTLELAHEVETVLQGPDWVDFLRGMYGDQPAKWGDALAGADRLRCIVNALTRIRFCTPEGEMEFSAAGDAQSAPPGYLPWFDVPERKTQDLTVVFGHWSALGLLLRPNLIALDTGCVWGSRLTAVRLNDRMLLQVDCPQYQSPGQAQ